MATPDAGDGWLVCDAVPTGICAGVTTTVGGESLGAYAGNNMALHVGDDSRRVARNRARLGRRLGASRVQWLQQVHAAHCLRATQENPLNAPAADAVFTTEAHLALAILTADCVPVLVWDDAAQIIGAAHAGWRGLQTGVLEQLLKQMQEAADLPPSRLRAWIGPAIGVQRYEVGAEVWSHFTTLSGGCVLPHPHAPAHAAGKRLLDLSAVAAQLLQRGGCGRVYRSGLCTYDDLRFYSHRRAAGAPTGRMASCIVLSRD